MGTNGHGNAPWHELQRITGIQGSTLNLSIPSEAAKAQPLMGHDGGVPQIILTDNTGLVLGKAVGYMPAASALRQLGQSLSAVVPQPHYFT
jgi:hypothetical protein